MMRKMDWKPEIKLEKQGNMYVQEVAWSRKYKSSYRIMHVCKLNYATRSGYKMSFF